MGTRQAKRQRRIDAAHQRYAATLLAVGLPENLTVMDLESQRSANLHGTRVGPPNWYHAEWREKIAEFYLASFGTGTPPGRKAKKRFVRGYVAWLKREITARKETEA